jgi:repressor of nif and glnA expression
MGDYENSEQRPDARLIILKALSAQTNESLHSGYLVKELLRLGIDKDRAWVHGEMEWLSEMGAVKLTRAETVMIATLTEKGARHLRRSIVIEGVSRPSRPGA